MAKTLTSDETMTAILSYLGILVLIPLFAVKKRNDFISFHLSQGLTLFIVEIVLAILANFLFFSFFAFGLYWIINLIWLAVLIIAVMAIIKALQGEKWVIPVIGNLKIINLK